MRLLVVRSASAWRCSSSRFVSIFNYTLISAHYVGSVTRLLVFAIQRDRGSIWVYGPMHTCDEDAGKTGNRNLRMKTPPQVCIRVPV